MRYALNHFLNNLTAVLELLLLTRVVFRALQANPAAFIVDVIYKITDILIWPVNYIFPNIPIGGSVFDLIAVSAMIFYGVVYLILHKAVNSL
jgi:hypothetical protein